MPAGARVHVEEIADATGDELFNGGGGEFDVVLGGFFGEEELRADVEGGEVDGDFGAVTATLGDDFLGDGGEDIHFSFFFFFF